MSHRTVTCPRCTLRFDDGATFCPQDGTRLVAEAGDPLVGTVLAERYRVVRLVGQGGMGRVYEAQHVNIVKRLAIKVLHPDAVADPVAAARFRLEARSASKIGHENIVEIEDSATLSDGTVYLAMEFLDGESLAERMRRRPPLSLPEAAALLLPVCRGLAAAHAARIVHRDLKPENIFLARRADRVVPKILDFGIAKVLTDEGALHLTRTGAIFGTPAYMSPQQAQGVRVDHRTDVYSMGVVLFELATGRVPFVADLAVQLLHQHIAADPPRPSSLAPERRIPAAVDDLLLRALAKEPDRRPATIEAFAAQLEAAVRGAPSTVATGISSPEANAATIAMAAAAMPSQRPAVAAGPVPVNVSANANVPVAAAPVPVAPVPVAVVPIPVAVASVPVAVASVPVAVASVPVAAASVPVAAASVPVAAVPVPANVNAPPNANANANVNPNVNVNANANANVPVAAASIAVEVRPGGSMNSRPLLIGAILAAALLLAGGAIVIALRGRAVPVAAAVVAPDGGAGTGHAAGGEPPHHDGPVSGTGHTVKEAAKTGTGSVRDGTRTVGRTVRSFFKEGPQGAKETWKENAATTKHNAQEGGRKTKKAAKDL